MVTGMVRSGRWIEVVPTCVIHGNLPAWRIPVVHVIEALLVVRKIVGIINVGIIVKPVPVGRLTFSTGLCIVRGQYRNGNHGYH